MILLSANTNDCEYLNCISVYIFRHHNIIFSFYLGLSFCDSPSPFDSCVKIRLFNYGFTYCPIVSTLIIYQSVYLFIRIHLVFNSIGGGVVINQSVHLKSSLSFLSIIIIPSKVYFVNRLITIIYNIFFWIPFNFFKPRLVFHFLFKFFNFFQRRKNIICLNNANL